MQLPFPSIANPRSMASVLRRLRRRLRQRRAAMPRVALAVALLLLVAAHSQADAPVLEVSPRRPERKAMARWRSTTSINCKLPAACPPNCARRWTWNCRAATGPRSAKPSTPPKPQTRMAKAQTHLDKFLKEHPDHAEVARAMESWGDITLDRASSNCGLPTACKDTAQQQKYRTAARAALEEARPRFVDATGRYLERYTSAQGEAKRPQAAPRTRTTALNRKQRAAQEALRDAEVAWLDCRFKAAKIDFYLAQTYADRQVARAQEGSWKPPPPRSTPFSSRIAKAWSACTPTCGTAAASTNWAATSWRWTSTTKCWRRPPKDASARPAWSRCLPRLSTTDCWSCGGCRASGRFWAKPKRGSNSAALAKVRRAIKAWRWKWPARTSSMPKRLPAPARDRWSNRRWPCWPKWPASAVRFSRRPSCCVGSSPSPIRKTCPRSRHSTRRWPSPKARQPPRLAERRRRARTGTGAQLDHDRRKTNRRSPLAAGLRALSTGGGPLRRGRAGRVVGAAPADHGERTTARLRAAAAALAVSAALSNYARAKDKMAAFKQLEAIASETIERWPDKPEADDARIALGQASLVRGDAVAALAVFENVDPRSARYPAAMQLAGQTHWRLYLIERNKGAAGRRGQARRRTIAG